MTDLSVTLQTTSKSPTVTSDVAPSKVDEVHERKKRIAAEITEVWTCLTHSLPDKPVLCWRAPTPSGQPTGPCYLITVSNVNVWTSLVVSTFHQSEPIYYTDSMLYYRSKIQIDSLLKLNPSRLLFSRMVHTIKYENQILISPMSSFLACLLSQRCPMDSTHLPTCIS